MKDPHQIALMATAQKMGLEIEDLQPRWHLDAVRYADHVVVLQGRIVPGLRHQTNVLIDHKVAAKAVLSAAGLPVPAGLLLGEAGDDEVATLLATGPVVVKPIDGTHGDGIATGLATVAAVRAHAATIGPALVERFITGDDLRIQAIGGTLVAACVRRPPQVVGDGHSTIRTLAVALERWTRVHNPANRVPLDAHTFATLAEQGVTLDHVPAAGEVIRLGHLANMARGATAVDVTDRLHPRWAEWVQVAGRAFGLSVFALDAITPDPSADPIQGAAILELNARPEWLHHTFSEGRTHDIPRMLLEYLLGRPLQ